MRQTLSAVGLAGVLALAGCAGGHGPEVELCKTEVLVRVASQLGDVDAKDMAKNVSTLADGSIEIRSKIIYRAGSSDESTQDFTCTMAKEGGEVRLLNIQIDFDVKKKNP